MEIKIQLIDDFKTYAPELLKSEGTGNLSAERATELFEKLKTLMKKEMASKVKLDKRSKK